VTRSSGARVRILLVLSHLVAVAVGALAGWYVATQVVQYVAMTRNVGSLGFYALHLELLRRDGPTEAYRDALLVYLAFLDEIRDQRDPLLTDEIVKGDTVLILARLARLAGARGDATESSAYVERAVRTCREIPWKSCSAEDLVRLTERLDRQQQGEGGDPTPAAPAPGD